MRDGLTQSIRLTTFFSTLRAESPARRVDWPE